MLTQLSLRNFKRFEAVDVPLGRITVLIGPNGSGKSSILHALALLHQSLGRPELVYSGTLVDLSSYYDVVYRQDPDQDLEIGYAASRTVAGIPLSYTYRIDSKERPSLLEYRWNLLGEPYTISWRGTDRQASLSVLGVTATVQVRESIGDHVQIISYIPDQKWEENGHIVSECIQTPSTDIGSWRYTPSSRGFTHASYALSCQKINELRSNVDNIKIAADLASTIAYDENVRGQVSDWMQDVTGVSIDFGLLDGRRTRVRSRSASAGKSITISNEGFGTNQLTFMLFQLAKTPDHGLNMIEEPEAHLHPVALARLADLFTRESKKDAKQLLLTTHSEHLLLGLLNNVAEGELTTEDLVVLYTEPTDVGVRVRQVSVNSDGLVEGGQPGFFDATLEAQRRHLDALTRSG